MQETTFEATVIDDPAPPKPRSRRARALTALLFEKVMAVLSKAPESLVFRTEHARWSVLGPIEPRLSPEQLEQLETDRERRLRGMPRQRPPSGSEREQKAAAKRARRAAKAAGRG